MEIYRTKVAKISGSNYAEVYKNAFRAYSVIIKNPKRKPFVKSAYFKRQKVFLELFWRHLHEKSAKERFLRLKYFSMGIDLLYKSRYKPIITANTKHSSELFYRFAGISKNKEKFFIQVKENKKTSEKWLMSIFPAD